MKPSSHGPQRRGFTLVEVLMALTIMAVIGLMANQLLTATAASRLQFDARVDEMRALLRATLRLEQDLMQVVARPIRDEYGDRQPALVLDEGVLEFTRTGWRNPTGARRAALQRVAWRIDGERQALVRLHWPVLDRAVDTLPGEAVVLREVSVVEFAVIDAAGNPHRRWPADDPLPQAQAQPDPEAPGAEAAPVDPSRTPAGIEVSFEQEGLGPVRRVFDIAWSEHVETAPPAADPDCDPNVDPDCPGFTEPDPGQRGDTPPERRQDGADVTQ